MTHERLVHVDDGMAYACPSCGLAALYRREWREGGVRVTNDTALRCGKCGTECGLADVQVRPIRPDALSVVGTQ